MNETSPPNPEKTLRFLKSLTLSEKETPVSLWVIHRRLIRKEARYTVKKLDVSGDIPRKLLKNISDAVSRSNHLEEYNFESTDQDERVFTHTIAETDLTEIVAKVQLGVDADRVETVDDLADAFALLTVVYTKNDLIVGFRRTFNGWSLKKLSSFYNTIFANRKLLEIDSGVVLKLDQKIDFYAFRDQIFILEKKNFEAGLNFRKGMESKKEQLLDGLKSKSLFNDVSPLEAKCGSNLHYLRKLTSIEKAGYYRDPNFIEKLKEANEKEGWKLQFVEGQLVMTPENVDELITLLSNKRVKSLINEEKFDVEGTVRPLSS
jgi:Domain of unknown function (DUF4868)